MRVLMGCDNFIRRESGRGGGVSDVRREASGARWSVTGGILYLPLSAFIRSLRPHAPAHHQRPPPTPSWRGRLQQSVPSRQLRRTCVTVRSPRATSELIKPPKLTLTFNKSRQRLMGGDKL